MAKKEKTAKAKKYTLADMAENSDMSQGKLREAFQELTDLLEEMPVGSTLGIPKLGTFRKVKTNPRMGRNPHSGESIKIPSKVKIGFKVSSNLRDM